MEAIKDSSGLTEEEFLEQYDADRYPKPSLTADIIITSETEGRLEFLLVKRGGHPCLGMWAFPGGFADRNERIEETADRELEEETGLTGIPLQELGVYSRPGRDPRGWTVSVAYIARVNKEEMHPQAGDDAAEAEWFTVETSEDGTFRISRNGSILPEQGGRILAFDHDDMLRDALRFLKQ